MVVLHLQFAQHVGTGLIVGFCRTLGDFIVEPLVVVVAAVDVFGVIVHAVQDEDGFHPFEGVDAGVVIVRFQIFVDVVPVDGFGVHDHAVALQVLLHGLNDGLSGGVGGSVHAEFELLAVLVQDAVAVGIGPAGLSQQFQSSGLVVGVVGHKVVLGSLREVQHGVVDHGVGRNCRAVGHFAVLFSVEQQAQSLADSLVGEDAFVGVDLHEVGNGIALLVDDDVGSAGQLLAGIRSRSVPVVAGAGLHLFDDGKVIGVELNVDLVDVHGSLVRNEGVVGLESRIGLQHDEGARFVGLNVERRVALSAPHEFVFGHGVQLILVDAADEAFTQVVQQVGTETAQMEGDLSGSFIHVDGFDVFPAFCIGRDLLAVFQGSLDVFRLHLFAAGVVLAFGNGEGHGQTVFGDFQACGDGVAQRSVLGIDGEDGFVDEGLDGGPGILLIRVGAIPFVVCDDQSLNVAGSLSAFAGTATAGARSHSEDHGKCEQQCN